MGVILHFLHRCSNHHGHHMDQKSKERKEQKIRSSRHRFHYRYRRGAHKSAGTVNHDSGIVRLDIMPDPNA